MNTFLVDPVVCLARRESPEDGAPLCGAWLSDHCARCGLCPGVHADDCFAPGERVRWPDEQCHLVAATVLRVTATTVVLDSMDRPGEVECFPGELVRGWE